MAKASYTNMRVDLGGKGVGWNRAGRIRVGGKGGGGEREGSGGCAECSPNYSPQAKIPPTYL